MKVKSIVVASSGYPTKTDSVCPFVEQIVNEFSRRGIRVTVVAPQSIIKHWLRHSELHPFKRTCQCEGGVPVVVYQPWVVSFGNSFDELNTRIRDWVIYHTLVRHKIDTDVYYGHFWHHAYSLYKYALKQNKPLFVVSGESDISLQSVRTEKELFRFCNYVRGVIGVSSKNIDESVEKHLLNDKSKSIVIPNAVDDRLFRKLDKTLLRRKYGIDENVFIVSFIGWFDDNKGVKRVSDALKILNKNDIKSFFIGSVRDDMGIVPNYEGILLNERLPHELIPEYLNMSDVFVLPSLHEGCNNSIIEAIACGLPVIASDMPFNTDILDCHNSIKVPPLDVQKIADTIGSLYNDRLLLEKLSKGALQTAATLTISKRADKIIEYIESKL